MAHSLLAAGVAPATEFGWGAIVVGALVGAWLLFWMIRSLRRTARALGVVVGHDVGSNSDGSSDFSRIVEFDHSGETIRFVDKIGTGSLIGSVGDNVRVSFSPGNPRLAAIASMPRTVGRLTGWLLLGGASAGLIALGLAALSTT